MLTADNETFKQHLSLRATSINDTLSALSARAPQANPNTRDMQIQLSRLLANEKQHVVELQRVMADNKQLNERLDNAAYRYMVAEKKFDKSKSAAASMLEIQNLLQSQSGPGETSNINGSGLNGSVDASGPASEEAETARRAAVAVADKRKEQLDVLEVENQKLTEELTATNARLNSLSDDDYAKTELFRAMKSQYEDVIKKINNLEAINVGLREEAQKLQAERTAYRLQVDEECRTSCSEAESQLAKMDLDLQRIRAERDLVLQEKATLEVSQTKHDLTLREIQALNSAGEDRLKALESEVERLRLRVGDSQPEGGFGNDLPRESEEDLRKEIASLRVQASMLNTELSSMQSAFIKSRAQAIKKSAEISSLEEQMERTREQKQRLEGNRFSERTLLDTKKLECDNLRRQSHKSGEIISQLKDAENRTRELCTNLEKQLAEHRENLYTLTEQNRFLQQRAAETKLTSEGVQNQVVELKTLLASKDSALVSAGHSQREAEAALEGMQVQLLDAKKKMEEWKEKAHANPTDEIDMLRVSKCLEQCALVPILTCHPESSVLWGMQSEPEGYVHHDMWPRCVQ
jgi:E3 ubiquitin-protein ligase BRE1